jgi:hypothetical protein
MPRALGVLAAAGVAFTLTACGGDDGGGDSAADTSAPSSASSSSASARTPPSTTSSSTPSTSPLVPAPGGRAAFVSFLEDQGVIPQYGSEDATVDLGLAICEGIDAGRTKADLIGILTSGSLPEDKANTVMAAAVVGFCPQHAPKLTS